jgi:hypothetical protein
MIASLGAFSVFLDSDCADAHVSAVTGVAEETVADKDGP